MDSLVRSAFFRPITAELPLRITPGPFEVTPTVHEAASRALAGHRSPAFTGMIADLRRMLLEAFEIDPAAGYSAVILTGTGTSAMEAMVAATVPVRRPLALVDGRFGRRLADMALLHNPESRVLDFGVGERIDPARVEQELDRHPEIDQLLFCVQDTREGLLNPYPELCELARERDLFVTLDGISAMVAEPLAPAERGVDLFTASSGKAIRGLPGLGIVCGRREVFESLDPAASRTYYLDLHQHYRIQEDRSEPRFAPATALYTALHQALVELLEQGVEARRETILRRTRRVREEVAAAGLELLRPAGHMPGSVTSVLLPPGVAYRDFQQAYQHRGFLVYSGSSAIEDCFQIGTAGYLTDEVLDEALEALAPTLSELNHTKETRDAMSA